MLIALELCLIYYAFPEYLICKGYSLDAQNAQRLDNDKPLITHVYMTINYLWIKSMIIRFMQSILMER